MITNASTDDKLRDMVVSQNDVEDGQIVGVVELFKSIISSYSTEVECRHSNM